MIVTFISLCEKKALSRTRRVLDAFADRIGDCAWQTLITQEGLLTVKKLLRKPQAKILPSVATGYEAAPGQNWFGWWAIRASLIEKVESR